MDFAALVAERSFPAGTPKPIITRLTTWMDKVAALPETNELLTRNGLDPLLGNAATLRAMLIPRHRALGRMGEAHPDRGAVILLMLARFGHDESSDPEQLSGPGADPNRRWAVLNDIKRVAACVPGAELTEVLGDDQYKGRIAVRLGPVALQFAGTVAFRERDASRRPCRDRRNG